MALRPWLILAALALARIGFGYQFQTVASLGPEPIPACDATDCYIDTQYHVTASYL